jgi:hypothetical protein
LMLTGKLQTQMFLVIKLQWLSRKIHGHPLDFGNCYGMCVSQLTTDMFRFPYCQIPYFPLFFTTYHWIFIMSKTTDANSGSGTGHTSGIPELTSGF